MTTKEVLDGLRGASLTCLSSRKTHRLFTISSQAIAKLSLKDFQEDTMGNRFAFRLLLALVAMATLAAVGFYGYNLGVAHGLAQNGHALAPGAGLPFAYWPHPWAFGFGFFPFFPLLFIILFWVVIARGLFWRGRWGRGWRHRHGGVPPAFEEWHRRAHAQPGSPTPSGPNA
jgi:hypothetical protein